MVNETITALQPHYTVVELCGERRDAILNVVADEEEEVLTFRGIVRTATQDKSFLSFGTGTYQYPFTPCILSTLLVLTVLSLLPSLYHYHYHYKGSLPGCNRKHLERQIVS